MTIDPTVFLDGVLTGLGYQDRACSRHSQKARALDGASFLKTLVLSLISSGVVSSTTGNVFLVIASSGVIVITLDKVINTLRNLDDTGTTTVNHKCVERSRSCQPRSNYAFKEPLKESLKIETKPSVLIFSDAGQALNARVSIVKMSGKKKPELEELLELHADIQSFVSTIDEAVEKGQKEITDIETTIQEAEAQKTAVKSGLSSLEVHKVFPPAKK